ncbi:hypothetical protein HDV62DRAFT_87207 [Trichoderma sp. SZMC 28011]
MFKYMQLSLPFLSICYHATFFLVHTTIATFSYYYIPSARYYRCYIQDTGYWVNQLVVPANKKSLIPTSDGCWRSRTTCPVPSKVTCKPPWSFARVCVNTCVRVQALTPNQISWGRKWHELAGGYRCDHAMLAEAKEGGVVCCLDDWRIVDYYTRVLWYLCP